MNFNNPLEKKFILVIDDEEYIRTSIKDYLEDRNFAVLEAENGKRGIEVFDRHKPHLILVDLRMPRVDGFAVVNHIRDQSPETPIIVISGTGILANAIEAIRLGAWDYIIKPIEDLAILLYAVERALERAQLLKDNRQYQENLEKRVKERTLDLQKEIAERRQAQKALKSEKDKLQAIVDGLSRGVIGIDIISSDFKILFQNQLLHERFGHDENKVCYKTYLNRNTPCESCPVQDAIKYNRVQSSEMIGKDNNIYKIISAPLHDPDTKVNKAIEVIIDITEQKLKEMKLHQSEERFRQMADNIEEIFFLTEKSTKAFLYISRMCVSMLGLSPQDICKNPQLFFDHIHPDDSPTIAFMDENRRYTETTIDEFRFVRPDKKVRWLRVKSFPVYNEKGEPFRSAGVATDITAFKEAQEIAHLKQEQLLQADKLASIGLMVSGVAHEINNPNNLIMMNAGVLKTFWEQIRKMLTNQDCFSPSLGLAGMSIDEAYGEFERMLESVISGSNRIQSIVNDLKNFSRADTGGIRDGVSVKSIIDGACAITNNLIKKSTDEFTISYDPNMPTIRANFQKLEQVIINLLTNACQALENRKGKITVTTKYLEKEKNLYISIADTGVGIAQKNLGQIMDPFFTTKRDSGGTGLGLSVSYGIIQEHQGRIEVQSKKGKGTNFDVIIPVK